MSEVSENELWQIQCLIPDLPAPELMMPYLKEMSDNRWYTNFGPLNKRFEAACAERLSIEVSGITVSTFSSATAAMEVLLVALGLKRGAKVLVPSLTFPATALAVIRAGYEPVIADIDPVSCQLTVEIARKCAARADIEAVIPVACYGIPLDMRAWERFESDTGLKVIVDAAAAFPNQRMSQTIPTVFSLHATKPFGVGEGGLVACGDKDLVQKAKLLSNFGFEDYKIKTPGSNAKMGEYFAAVGLLQLERIEEIASKRRALWDAYQTALAPLSDALRLIGAESGAVPANLLVETKAPISKLVKACDAKRIQTRHWYLPPLHNHSAFADFLCLGEGEGGLPVHAERLTQHMTGLPFHAFMTSDNIEEIGQTISAALSGS